MKRLLLACLLLSLAATATATAKVPVTTIRTTTVTPILPVYEAQQAIRFEWGTGWHFAWGTCGQLASNKVRCAYHVVIPTRLRKFHLIPWSTYDVVVLRHGVLYLTGGMFGTVHCQDGC